MSAQAQAQTTSPVYFTTPGKHDVVLPNNPGVRMKVWVRGADGGDCRTAWKTWSGGQGATVSLDVVTGYGAGKVTPGSTLRFIVGEQGGSTDGIGLLGKAGGGGGGTGVAYGFPHVSWGVLAVAGGGGGAMVKTFNKRTGLDASATPNGRNGGGSVCGNGLAGHSGGINGMRGGGDAGYKMDGGASLYRGSLQGSGSCFWRGQGFLDSPGYGFRNMNVGPGASTVIISLPPVGSHSGSYTAVTVPKGGNGCGAGGFASSGFAEAKAAGGGGGGYSGGGAGAPCGPGGGGGSWFDAAYGAGTVSMGNQGKHGSASYQYTFLPRAPTNFVDLGVIGAVDAAAIRNSLLKTTYLPERLNVDVSTQGSTFHTSIGLYDPTGRLLASDSRGSNSQINYDLQPGDYFLAVAGNPNTMQDGFVVGSAASQGGTISLTVGSQSVSGAVASGQHIMYRFTVVGTPVGAVDIGAVGIAGRIDMNTFGSTSDTLLVLFDSTGTRIAANDDTNGLQSQILRDLPAGTYHLAVTFYPNDLHDDYQTSLYGVGVWPNTVYDVVGIIGAKSFKASIARFEPRFYRFIVLDTPSGNVTDLGVVGNSGSVLMNTQGSAADTVLGLYDTSGNLVERRAEAVNGLNYKSLTSTLTPGVYYLGVGAKPQYPEAYFYFGEETPPVASVSGRIGSARIEGPFFGSLLANAHFYRFEISDTVGYFGAWKFDDIMRQTATSIDVGQKSLDATIHGPGATALIPGPDIGSFNPLALELKSNAYAEIPNDPGLNFSAQQDFTVSVWIKPAATQPAAVYGDSDVIEKWSGAGGYPFVIRYLNQLAGANEGLVQVARFDGVHAPSILSTTRINDGLWHHVAFAKRGSLLYLYVDGAEQGQPTTDTTTGNTTNTSPLYIGRRGGWLPNYFAGAIDELRILGAGLAPSEIRRLAHK